MRRFLFVCILVLLPLSGFSKSGKAHFDDMQDIFPFVQVSANDRVLDLYHTVNSYLDEPNWVETELKRPHMVVADSLFSTLKYGNHRVWYHWGLDKGVYGGKYLAREHHSLSKVMKKNLPDDAVRERFWKALQAEDLGRLKEVVGKAYSSLGFGKQSGKLPDDRLFAFVQVLYSIHVMGDHTTKLYTVLRPEKDLRQDIYSAVRTIGGAENRALAEKFISYLERTAPESDVSRGTEDGSAQKFIDAMKDRRNGFSNFVLKCKGKGYDYRTLFYKSGLVLKEVVY